MSDAFDAPAPVDPTDARVADPSADSAEVALDVRAFLPEGVELGEPDAQEADGEPAPAPAIAEVAEAPGIDLEALDQIERDLDAVDAAIAAIEAGTYGIDPATGAPIDDAILAEDPTFLG